MSYYSTSFTWRAVSFTTSDLRIALRITRGINELPSVRGRDTIIPGLPGRVPRNRIGDVLTIEADGFVMGSGANEQAQRDDFRDIVTLIRGLMDPTDTPGEIVATLEDGTTQSITARAIDIIWGDDDIPAYRALSCRWESVDAADWVVAGS